MKKKIKLLLKTPSIEDLDDLFRVYLHSRDKVCRKCGKTTQLQVSHVISRSVKSTRWDPSNGFLLCLRHHIFWAHKQPLEYYDWVKELLGEKEFDKLRMRAHDTSKIDRNAVKVYLTARLKELA